MRKSIDVSQYQGVVDWNEVKVNGVEHAILRSTIKNGTLDTSFIRNYEECVKNEIEIDIYKYVYATSIEEAEKEVENLLEKLVEYDKINVYWIDIEDESIFNKSNIKILTKNIYNTYKDAIESSLRKKVGLYTGQYAYNTFFDKSFFDLEYLWIARYYKGYNEMSIDSYDLNYIPISNLNIWQFTSSGIIDGIIGNVDMNVIVKEVGSYEMSGSEEYYEIPHFTLIDSLEKIGVDSSYINRSKIACKNGIEQYEGTFDQNMEIYEKLYNGELKK